MGPAVSGRELCDIDRVLFRVSKSQLKKMGGLGTTKIYRLCYISLFMKQKPKLSVCNIPYVLVVSGPANFSTRDFINCEYHSLRPLTAGPLRDPENMESSLEVLGATQTVCKVGCVFPKVVVSKLLNTEFGRIDHQKYAHHFNMRYFLKILVLTLLQLLYFSQLDYQT